MKWNYEPFDIPEEVLNYGEKQELEIKKFIKSGPTKRK